MKNQIKKLLSLALVVVMCLSTLALCVSAEECAHTNKIQTGTVEATCEDFGYSYYKCEDCGSDFVADVRNPLGHEFEVTEKIAETCKYESYEIKKCSRCDEPEKEEYNPVEKEDGVDCKYGDPTYEVINGKLMSVKICKVCGHRLEENVQSGHSHKIGYESDGTKNANMKPDEKSLVKPTCTTNGSIDYVCAVEGCGLRVKVSIDKTHQYTIEYAQVNATCTEDGKLRYRECALCGAVQIRNAKNDGWVDTTADKLVIAAGHKWYNDANNDGIITDAESDRELVSAGNCVIKTYNVYEYNCLNDKCDEVKVISDTELPHKFITSDVSYPATCVKYGLDAKICTECGTYTATEIAPKKFYVSKGADGKNGTAKEKEDDIWLTLDELKLAANASAYGAKKIDIVCGDYAYYEYTLLVECGVAGCGYCTGKVVKVPYGDLMAHTWADYVGDNAATYAYKAPTCFGGADGKGVAGQKQVKYCTYCYENYTVSETDETPLLVFDKQIEIDAALAKLATDATDAEKLAAMLKVYEIPALDHKLTDVQWCSKEKVAMKVCTNEGCEYVEAVELSEEERAEYEASTEESHIIIVKTVKATCEKNGETIEYCYTCQYKDEPVIIPALGHKYLDTPTEVIPGSCQLPVGYVYECQNGCEKTKFENGSLDKTAEGHKLAMGETFADYISQLLEKGKVEIVKDGATVILGGYELKRQPTCSVKALFALKCTECGVSFTYTGDYARNEEKHNRIDEYEVAPDCSTETNGKKGAYCTVCKDFVPGEYVEIPYEHDEKGVFAAQNPCDNDFGWAEFKYCKACEKAEKAAKEADPNTTFAAKRSIEAIKNKVQIKGHDKVEETYKGYAATCKVAGVTPFTYCKVCENADTIVAEILKVADSTKDPRYIAPKGHQYDDANENGKRDSSTESYYDITVGTQSCEGYSYKLRTCKYCEEGYKITSFADAKDHKWDKETEHSFNLDEKATGYNCEKDGYKYYKCTVCGAEDQIEGTVVKAHHRDKFGNEFTKQCTSIGYGEKVKCVLCQIEIEGKHNFQPVANGADAKEPTCTEPGYEISICADCGTIEDKDNDGKGDVTIIPSFGDHTVFFNTKENKWAVKTITKGDNGEYEITDTLYSNLDAALEAAKVEVVKEECVDPTYINEGKLVYICAECEEKIEKVIPKLSDITLDITYDNTIVPGAAIVNGGLVTFTVGINANNVEAAALKAEFLYDASVLTLVESTVAPIFDSENTKTSSEVGNKVTTVAGEKIGRIVVVADAASSTLTSSDVTLNGENIAFVTLTFRVSTIATELNGFIGVVSEVSTAAEKMIVDLDVDAIFENATFVEKEIALEEKYADTNKAYADANKALVAAYDALDTANATLVVANNAVASAQIKLADAEAALKDATEAEKEAAEAALKAAQADLKLAQDAAKAAQRAVTMAQSQITVKIALLESAEIAYVDYVEAKAALEEARIEWAKEGMIAIADVLAAATMVDSDIAILGDVNGNGKVDMADAVAIRKMQFTNNDGTITEGEFTVASEEKDENGKPIMVECNYTAEADVDMDGDVDTVDYALLQQLLATKIDYEDFVLTSQN